MAKKKENEDNPDDDSRDDDNPDSGDDDMGGFGSGLPPNFMDYMNKMLKELLKNFDLGALGKDLEKQMRAGGPIRPAVFGFNIGVGPDGKPTLQNFGNIKQKQGKPEVNEVRNPLVDIVEEADELIVVAEVPGVKKEDIELSATETTLSIQAKSQDKERHYEKVVDLPAKINPNVAKARYTNGILEVRLQKVGSKKKQGSSIRVD